MGFKYLSSDSSYKTNLFNPNPHKFKVEQLYAYPNCYVSLINYPNCSNFEGNKILVTTYNPLDRDSIDPHFYQNSGLLARFEPSSRGMALAHSLAESI